MPVLVQPVHPPIYSQIYPQQQDLFQSLNTRSHDETPGSGQSGRGRDTQLLPPLTTEAAARQTNLPGTSKNTDVEFMSLLNE